MLEMISPVRAALLSIECVIVVVCAIVLFLHFYLFPNRCWGLCSLRRRAGCGRRFQRWVVPTEPEILTEVMKLLCRVYHSLPFPFLNWNPRHPCLSVANHWIELNPGHVGFGDIGEMASRTFGHRRFRGSRRIWQWMMPEGEEAPAVGLGKTLAVFHR